MYVFVCVCVYVCVCVCVHACERETLNAIYEDGSLHISKAQPIYQTYQFVI